MHILGQALRSDRELDAWIAAHRVNGSVAAHQGLDELGQPGPIPPPCAFGEAFGVRELAHQLQIAQPCGEGIRDAGDRAGWEIADAMAPDVERWKELRDLVR